LICLDTDILVDAIDYFILERRDLDSLCETDREKVERAVTVVRTAQKQNEPGMIPAPVVSEYLSGIPDEDRNSHREILTNFGRVRPLDKPSSLEAARLYRRFRDRCGKDQREQMSEDRKRLVRADSMIAAIALVHRAQKLVTHNVSDFEKMLDESSVKVVEPWGPERQVQTSWTDANM
jgi:predicted nucleic acid-binding protein